MFSVVTDGKDGHGSLAEINIHKSGAVTLYQIKHPILIRGGSIRYNVTARDVLFTI